MNVNALAFNITAMTSPSPIVLDVWVGLLRAHKAAFYAVEKALKKASLPPLAWYDVLLELERGGDKGLRPFELERALLLPQYGVSRLLVRLGDTGLIRKIKCDEDGRGHRLLITQTGRKIRRRMWPVYSQAVEQAVGKKLTDREARLLADLLRSLK